MISTSNEINTEMNREMNLINHNLRDMVRNLGNEYNIKNNIYNNQRKLLNKYDYYINIHNKKLNEQLNDLENIQNNITTKDSLIKGNQQSYIKKEKTFHTLKVFIGVSSTLVFIILLYLSNKISLASLLLWMIIIIIMYGIYVAYVFNLFYLKSVTNFSAHELKALKDDLYEEGREIEDRINEYLNGNCDCPNNNGNKKNGNYFQNIKSPHKHFLPHSATPNDGFFYYDGSAPQERIIPPIIPKVSRRDNPPKDIGKNKFAIDWQSRDYHNNNYHIKSSHPGINSKNNCSSCSTQRRSNEKPPKEFWTVDL